MLKKTKILIVDDSSFIRSTLKKILTTENTEVIGEAIDGKNGVELNKKLKPDVVLLDVEMPVMNGLEALKEIMKTRPCPVIMFSTLISDGADTTIKALELGACDFVSKKSSLTTMNNLKEEILEKVKHITHNSNIINQIKRRSMLQNQKAKTKQTESLQKQRYGKGGFKINNVSGKERFFSRNIGVMAIGISTGGPAALMQILPGLPANYPIPILIAQHMPPFFTKSLADRLDGKCEMHVKEAETGDILKAGNIYIAEGGKHMVLKNRNTISITEQPEDALYKPCVDVLFDSVAKYYKNKALFSILTGMGKDGTESLKKFGIYSYVITQTIDSCIATGMPESVTESKLADEIYDLDDMANAYKSFFDL